MTSLNLYDGNGKIIGRIIQSGTKGDLILENATGKVKGRYFASDRLVVDANGRTVARGGSEMLASLLHT
jgi:hypothetical protein